MVVVFFGHSHVSKAFPSSASMMRLQSPLHSSASDVQHSLEQGKVEALFNDFVDFLKKQQTEIITEIEATIERNSGETFGCDTWGVFDAEADTTNMKSGGITRVIQGGDCIEKGACSFTLISDGILTKERAANIRARQFREGDTEAINIAAGDTYSAAALSMVLHSRSPLVPTFRSDVRVFLVRDQDTGESWAWFGGELLSISPSYACMIRHIMYLTMFHLRLFFGKEEQI